MRLPILALVVLLTAGFTRPAHATTTIAIGYFDNTSNNADWQPLSKGLADMLITDLAATDGLVVVERERLQQVVDEIKLGASKFIDPATAQKLGKGLGASHMLIGGFLVQQGKLRVDARLVEVGTGKIGLTAQELGAADDVFAIEAKLAEKLRGALQVVKKLPTGINAAPPKVSADDVKTLGQGLDALDAGKIDEARRILGALAARKPDFSQVQRGLDSLSKRIKQVLGASKAAPEKLVALMTAIEQGKAEACQPLMQEVTNLLTATVRASTRVMMPDGGDVTEVGRLLAAFYAVTLHALDVPILQTPVCYGQQPAGTVLSMFLMSLQSLAQQQLRCDPLKLQSDPNPERQRASCERMLKRFPDMTDSGGKVVVAGRDFPILMVQMGQIFVERFPASPYSQAILPQLQEFVDHFRVASLSPADKAKALAVQRSDVTRKAIAQMTAYADLSAMMGLAPASEHLKASMAGVGVWWQLHLNEGDMTVGLKTIELSVDGGKVWHAWPGKDDAPGWAYAHLKFEVAPGRRKLVPMVQQLIDKDGAKVPKVDVVAKRFAQSAVGLEAAPWSPERYADVRVRLIAEDDTELAVCLGKYEIEMSKSSDGKPTWQYGRVNCSAK